MLHAALCPISRDSYVNTVFIRGQRRNEGEQGGRNSPGAESLRGRRKVLTMSKVLSLAAHLLPKDLRFEHGGAKLVSCPGRHLTSLHPCSCISRKYLYQLFPLKDGVPLTHTLRGSVLGDVRKHIHTRTHLRDIRVSYSVAWKRAF